MDRTELIRRPVRRTIYPFDTNANILGTAYHYKIVGCPLNNSAEPESNDKDRDLYLSLSNGRLLRCLFALHKGSSLGALAITMVYTRNVRTGQNSPKEVPYQCRMYITAPVACKLTYLSVG